QSADCLTRAGSDGAIPARKRAHASIHFHSAMIMAAAAISFRIDGIDVSLWSGLSRRRVHPGTLLGTLPVRCLARGPFYSSRVEQHVRGMPATVARIVPQEDWYRLVSQMDGNANDIDKSSSS
ncbi:hypothetical protein, partial [Streptomyces parvulus]|uniref:hypothetical protein n=1 Tax=Streptomyces parvulus TaxID=146923 RepID=UPI0033B6EE2F